MIVALLNQKGGVGKTTLATHIAGELAMRGQHVVLLDADPQGSSLDWTQRRSQQGLPRLFSAANRSRHHRRPAAHRGTGALRAAGGRARADPRAAQPLRPVGQRGDGQPDPRGAGVQADAARGVRYQPPRQHHGDRPRSPRCLGRPTAAGTAGRSTPAHRLCRERGSRSPGPRTGARQRRSARGQQPGRRAAEVVAMSGKRIGIGARPLADPQAEAWIRQGAALDSGKAERYSARKARGYGVQREREVDVMGHETGQILTTIAGIDRELVLQTKTRRQEILDYVKEHPNASHDEACKATRKKKEEPPFDQVVKDWQQTFANIARERPDLVPTTQSLKQTQGQHLDPHTFDEVLQRMHENEAMFCEHDLVRELGSSPNRTTWCA
ncbi:hypothetical protein G6F24_013639 [Rhizopus arrhizus]|nr:hypothetical protein G6F24_013639 [Rhizopus arrhizus]